MPARPDKQRSTSARPAQPEGGNGAKRPDERVNIDLPFKDALRGLLAVKPDSATDPPNGKPAKPKKPAH